MWQTVKTMVSFSLLTLAFIYLALAVTIFMPFVLFLLMIRDCFIRFVERKFEASPAYVVYMG